jgi:hypothetical protein
VERRQVKRVRRRIAALVAIVLVVAAAVTVRRRNDAPPVSRGPLAILAPAVRAPEGVRIRVQVVNTTRTRGLARRATRLLRDRGFDVVEVGTTREAHDSTLVLDRSGHPEWAGLVAEVVGGRAEARPDSSRYLDVTVLLGATWRPPAESFHP